MGDKLDGSYTSTVEMDRMDETLQSSVADTKQATITGEAATAGAFIGLALGLGCLLYILFAFCCIFYKRHRSKGRRPNKTNFEGLYTTDSLVNHIMSGYRNHDEETSHTEDQYESDNDSVFDSVEYSDIGKTPLDIFLFIENDTAKPRMFESNPASNPAKNSFHPRNSEYHHSGDSLRL